MVLETWVLPLVELLGQGYGAQNTWAHCVSSQPVLAHVRRPRRFGPLKPSSAAIAALDTPLGMRTRVAV